MFNTLRFAGDSTLNLLADSGALWRLASSTATTLGRGLARRERIRSRAAIEQILRAGYGSLPLVVLICFLIGIIMALQSAYQLRSLGAIDLVPNLVAISMSRELAPLLTAIIVAGRFGSAIAAELGTMKVSQEIDALTVMGLDPVSFLVAPRILALMVSLPLLTVFADVVGILGGLTISTLTLEIGPSRYMAMTIDALVLQDIFTGLVKSVAFAGIIGLIGCHQGLSTRGGAEEVGRATTTAVVRSIVLIIGADLFVTAIFFVRGS
jgi:phospholipid/cholesterol/gamma-HCH transport system permease protein